MVAYSFQKRFAPPILSGIKRQTIRARGKRRHARRGEALQLYTGMRTKHCKLIARALCEGTSPVTLDFFLNRVLIGDDLSQRVETLTDAYDLDAFALRDGFTSWEELREFWREVHRTFTTFTGVCITWGDIRS